MRPRFRCAHCHSNSARLGPDGFSDCGACGYTSRPKTTALVRINGRCVPVDLTNANATPPPGEISTQLAFTMPDSKEAP